MTSTPDETPSEAWSLLSNLEANSASTVILTAYPFVVVQSIELDSIIVMITPEEHTRCEDVAHITGLPAAPSCVAATLLYNNRLRIGVACESEVIIFDFNDNGTKWKISHRLEAPGPIVTVTLYSDITLVATTTTLWRFTSERKPTSRSIFHAPAEATILRAVYDGQQTRVAVLLQCKHGVRLALMNLLSEWPVSYTPPFPPGTTVEQIALVRNNAGQTLVYCLISTHRGFTAFKFSLSFGSRQLYMRPVAFLEPSFGRRAKLLSPDHKPGIIVALLWNSDCVNILIRSVNTNEKDRYARLSIPALRTLGHTNRLEETVVPIGVAFDEQQGGSTVVLLLRLIRSQGIPPRILAITLTDRQEALRMTNCRVKGCSAKAFIRDGRDYSPGTYQTVDGVGSEDGQLKDLHLLSQFSLTSRSTGMNATSFKQIHHSEHPRTANDAPRSAHCLGVFKLEKSPLDPLRNQLSSPYRTAEHNNRSQLYRRNISRRAKEHGIRLELRNSTNELILDEHVDYAYRLLSLGTVSTTSRAEKRISLSEVLAPVSAPVRPLDKNIRKIKHESASMSSKDYLTRLYHKLEIIVARAHMGCISVAI